MKTIRNFVYAALLAVTALNFTPSLASAQEPARQVHADSRSSLGECHASRPETTRFPSTPTLLPHAQSEQAERIRTGYMVLVPSIEDSKPSDQSRLILEATPDGSYVSAMQLPEFGMTLRFTVPSHTTERQIAKAGTTATASGQ